MSFGHSVGDFVTVGTLAWKVYRSCKAVPESFVNISGEVLSLHAVLKEAEETVFAQPLFLAKQASLEAVANGYQRVLEELESLVEGYEKIQAQSKIYCRHIQRIFYRRTNTQ